MRIPDSVAQRRRRAGLSLLESVGFLSLCGVLTAAFVPTFLKQLRFSKLAEASERLDALYRSTAAYYASTQPTSGGLRHGCLPESAGPTPEVPSPEPVVVDFSAPDTPGSPTWRALGADEPSAIRYSYQLVVAAPGCEPRATSHAPVVTFRAVGDLDGDGTHSLFERHAKLSGDQRALLPNGPLRSVQRIE